MEPEKEKFFKVKLIGGSSYIQPESELKNVLDGELDGLELGDKVLLEFSLVDITREQYEKLPEFSGH